MLTSNVINRVFQIKIKNATGTCFSVDIDNRQYLITAKHVISHLKNNDIIEIFYENNWNKINLKLIGHSEKTDISVFAFNQKITNVELILPTAKGMAYGQDVYFLGFPFGLNTTHNLSPFPLPFVKKGIISNFSSNNGLKVLYIDGYNNPGFSGGPVVIKDLKTQTFQVVSVISGYRIDRKQINKINGKQIIGSNLYFDENTGIILSYSIEHALELIRQNPIGFKLN
jgi:S1-C subfamily serine protease